MLQPNLEIFVFYHDRQKLERAVDVDAHPEFHFIDLNQLEIPESVRIEGLDEDENRAALSEYLGHLAIKPKAEMVGTFTYSVPLKFSRAWARETTAFETLLPALDFRKISSLRYAPQRLYGLEFRRWRRIENEAVHRRELAEKLPVTTFPDAQDAPLKGGVIVERKPFEEYQRWLPFAIRFLLDNYDWRDDTSTTPFSGHGFGGKSEAERKVGRFRSGLGGEIERACAYFFSKRFDDRVKKRIGSMVNSQGAPKYLRPHIQKERVDNNLVVAFASSKYLDVYNNWEAAMARAGASNYMIYTLDDRMQEILSRRGTTCYPAGGKPDYSDIWLTRAKRIRELLRSGVNVINTDIDAIWKANPSKYLMAPGFDIMASQGTYWPRDVHAKWGFVLCCGFIGYRSNAKVIDLLDEIIERFDITEQPDDQLLLNRLLLEDGLDWTTQGEEFEIRYNDLSIRCSDKLFVSTNSRFTVGVLPHRKFQRVPIPEAFPELKVFHPVSEKTNEGVLETLRRFGFVTTETEEHPA